MKNAINSERFCHSQPTLASYATEWYEYLYSVYNIVHAVKSCSLTCIGFTGTMRNLWLTTATGKTTSEWRLLLDKLNPAECGYNVSPMHGLGNVCRLHSFFSDNLKIFRQTSNRRGALSPLPPGHDATGMIARSGVYELVRRVFRTYCNICQRIVSSSGAFMSWSHTLGWWVVCDNRII